MLFFLATIFSLLTVFFMFGVWLCKKGPAPIRVILTPFAFILAGVSGIFAASAAFLWVFAFYFSVL